MNTAILSTGGVLLYLPHHLDLASEDSVGHSTCMSVLARRRAIMESIVQPKRSCLGLSRCATIEGGRGCNKFVPVLRGNGTKIAPTGYIFDQPPGGMSWIRGKLADHVGGHVVLSPEEGVLVTSPGTESSYPRPPQSLNKCTCCHVLVTVHAGASQGYVLGIPLYPTGRSST